MILQRPCCRSLVFSRAGCNFDCSKKQSLIKLLYSRSDVCFKVQITMGTTLRLPTVNELSQTSPSSILIITCFIASHTSSVSIAPSELFNASACADQLEQTQPRLRLHFSPIALRAVCQHHHFSTSPSSSHRNKFVAPPRWSH